MKILITGASGFVAGGLRQTLVKDRFEVVSASRHTITPMHGETTVAVSSYDDPALCKAAAGCDAVIHLVGSGRQSIHMQYTDSNFAPANAVSKMCSRLSIPRLVYLSGLGVSASATSGYFISKHMAERAIRKAAEPVILRPSYIIGAGDHLTAGLRMQARTGTITIPGSGRHMMQPVSIHDTVRILEMAAGHKRFAGRTLDLVGPQAVTFAQFVQMFAGGTHIIHGNIEQMYKDAMHGGSAYGLEDLNIMMGGYTGDHHTLAEITGIRFQTIREMLQASSTP